MTQIKDIASDKLKEVTGKVINDKIASAGAFLDNIKDWLPNAFDREKLSIILNEAHRHTGKGSYNYGMLDFFRSHDRYGTTNLPGNRLQTGLTFITKPSLCLQATTLKAEEQFHALLEDDPESMMYAIRCNLDPTFMKDEFNAGITSSLVSYKDPFYIAMGGGLIGFSGSPDLALETETVGPGFGGETQTRVTGYDYLQKTHSLTLNFRDIQGGPIFHSILYQLLFMAYAADGRLPIYSFDADQYLLYYTQSIYRFVLDPSFRYIEHYAKYTGCFPDAHSIGELFNFSETERVITSGGEFSVPYKCCHAAYNHPFILRAFNQLVRRYAGNQVETAPMVSYTAGDNYCIDAVPYISYYNRPFESNIFSNKTTAQKGKLMLTFRKV